jgi:hypothetical protein
MLNKFFRSRYLPYLIPILSGLSAVLIVLIKFLSYRSWQYTSDLFIYDSFLKEMVFQGRLMDYSYGNLFGDHAYLFLYLFYPFKLLLKDHFVYLLLAFNPLLFLISTLLIYRVLAARVGMGWGVIGSLAYLAGFGTLYQGLLEGIYGFHPDLGCGFVLISLACLVLLQTEGQRKTIWNDIAIYALSLFFLSYKEEMAILGAIFFLILFIATRQKRFGWMTGIALLVTVADFILIKESRTPFNRSNMALLNTLLQGISSQGISFLFVNPRGPQSSVIAYWGFLAAAFILYHLRWYRTKAVNPYLLALFYVGLVKLGTSLLLQDFRLTSWHSLPGVFMVIAAFLLQMVYDPDLEQSRLKKGLISLAAISMLLLVVFELLPMARLLREDIRRQETVASYGEQISKLKDLIPEGRVVSVPMFSGSEFTDSRITFYPAGVFHSSAGLADYVLMPVDVHRKYTGHYDELYPLEESPSGFQLIGSTKNFDLYQRTGLDPDSLAIRETFFSLARLPELIPLP